MAPSLGSKSDAIQETPTKAPQDSDFMSTSTTRQFYNAGSAPPAVRLPTRCVKHYTFIYISKISIKL